MNKRQMTPKEFLEKCDWEGGGLHEGLEYGLTPRDLDDSNPKFKEIVSHAYNLYWQYQKAIDEAEKILSLEDFQEE